jgi:hypothetical protein
MNGRNYNDFKVATVRPEPVEGCSSIFARGSFFTYIPNLEHFFCQNQAFILFRGGRSLGTRGGQYAKKYRRGIAGLHALSIHEKIKGFSGKT